MKSSERRPSVAHSTRLRRTGLRSTEHVRTTLGELVAAAFDVVGGRAPDVARLLASSELGRAAHGRIVLVG